jgi:hypothetical protein
MKTWKILRDCRLRGGVAVAMLGIARPPQPRLRRLTGTDPTKRTTGIGHPQKA